MTIREEIQALLSQSGQTQYAFVNAYNAQHEVGERITRSNFAAYLKGKDTISAKRLDGILDALRAAASTTLGENKQQNYLPIINIAEKQIFINKADNNQRLHIEYSKPYLSATITDISEGKAFILLNLDVKVKDNPETKLRELSDFIQKQFPTAQWQLLNYPDQPLKQ